MIDRQRLARGGGLRTAEWLQQPTKAARWPWPWPFDPESGVRVTCDVGYLYANFGLPRPLCSRLRPDVCDRRQTDRRQTDVRQKRRL